jgi:hypothetical protein
MLRVVFLRQEIFKRHTSVSVSQHSVVTFPLPLTQMAILRCMHKDSLSQIVTGLPNILTQRLPARMLWAYVPLSRHIGFILGQPT